MPKISFVMPCHKDWRTVKTTINSILDQDIKDLEVIVVVNGKDQEKEVKAVKSIKDPRVVLLELEEGNACKARNAGAEIAQSPILSFLPADAFLYPGAVRTWLEAFEKNDVDVVYGGYRFVDERKLWTKLDPKYGEPDESNEYAYPGAPYDAYQLTCSNFIDGSFPVKKEIFDKVQWDPSVKSLQDWDLWLGVQNAGGKFHYINDVFFDTGWPHAGGLSDHSSRNWIEIVKEVRAKNGIDDKTLCVTGNGAPFHAKNIAEVLNADYREQVNIKPHEYLAIYQIGFYFAIPQMLNMQIENFKVKGRKIIHWIGTDVMHWDQVVSKHSRGLYLQYFKQNDIVHLCESDFVKQELAGLGIDAEVVPLPPKKFYNVTPLPEKFTIGVYAPYQHERADDFYYTELIKEVAKAMPDVEFKLFGDPTLVTKQGNLEWCGYIKDMETFINSCSALVRLTKHDGMPISIVEFQSAGRNILFNKPVPHALSIQDVSLDNVVAGIRELEKLGLNESGAAYVREAYDHEAYKQKIYSLTEYDPKRYWENLAQSWDTHAKIDNDDYRTIKKLVDKREFNTVLDIGCGNGIWSELFEGKDYTGIDISAPLIDAARKKYPDKAFWPIKVEDFHRDTKVDLVFGYTILQHVLPKDIKKAAEALKKVGRKMILVEPTGFQSVNYCHDHDYEKLFKVIKKTQLGPRVLYEIDLEA